MKNLHIKDSYKVWSTLDMFDILKDECYKTLYSFSPSAALNRTYESMYVEWWLHNIGYYVTKPFCFIDVINKINIRCKDVDLEEWT